MSTIFNTDVTTVQSGWNCSNCGQWVPYGQNHYCGSTAVNYPTYTFPNCEQCKRVTELIEKVLKLLEDKNSR